MPPLVKALAFACLFGTCLVGASAHAKEWTDIADLNLEELDKFNLDELADVTVTATKDAVPINRAPAIISVIDAEHMIAAGYQSVADAIGHLPGIYLRDDLIHPEVGLRGIDAGLRAWSRSIKVMINGRSVDYRSDTSNWLGPELIPLSAIKRIEVIRGPGSTLYGPNSFLGVVNVLTKEGTADTWVDGTVRSGLLLNTCPAEYGSVISADGKRQDLCSKYYGTTYNPHVNVDVAAGHKITVGKATAIDFLVAAAGQFEDRSGLMLPEGSPHFRDTGSKYLLRDPADLASKGDTETTATAFAAAALDHKKWGKLRLEGQYRRFNRAGEFTDWGALTHENRVSQFNLSVGLDYEKTFERLPLDLKARTTVASGGHTGDNHLQIAPDTPYWVRKDGGYLGIDGSVELKLSSRFGKFILGGGITDDNHELPSIYRVDKLPGPDGGPPTVTPSYTLGSASFINLNTFFQYYFAPFDWLDVVAGVSYDYHNVYGKCTTDFCPGFNSRLGVSLSIFKNRLINLYSKLLYGSSFKAPSAELIYGTPYVISGISGNRDLQAQSARTFEAAIGLQLADMVQLFVNGYYNQILGKVEYIQDRSFIQAQNSSDLGSIGMEVELEVRPIASLKGYASFSVQTTWVDSCLLTDESLCQQFTEFNLLYPDFLLGFGANYELKPAYFSIAVDGRYVTSRFASQSNRLENVPTLEGYGKDFKAYRVPGYVTLNIYLSSLPLEIIPKTKTYFTLSANNVLNTRIIEPGFNGIDIPMVGLRVLAGIRHTF